MDACDDPYKILANNLVAEKTDKELKKILHDAKTVRRYISREVNDADFYGDFLDCVMVGLVKSGKYRCVHRTLRETSDFFYSYLDLPRLRKEIRHYCKEYGRQVE